DGIGARSLLELVTEVVDQLFDTHSIFRRPLIPSQKAPDVCIGRRIDIAGKRGQRLLADCNERIVRDGVVPIGVAWHGRNDAVEAACPLARHCSAVCQRGRDCSGRRRRRRGCFLLSLKYAAEDSAQDAVSASISFLCASLLPLLPLLPGLPLLAI